MEVRCIIRPNSMLVHPDNTWAYIRICTNRNLNSNVLALELKQRKSARTQISLTILNDLI
jgi:hypothetical protein